MATHAREAGKKAVWAAGAVFLLAAGAEVLLRWLAPTSARQTPFDRSPALYSPDRARRHPWSSGATNALRIAVIGDSAAAGVGDQRNEGLAQALEWLCNLNALAPPVDVRLYARPSATYQQVSLVQQALEARARVVVLAVNLNDTEDWTRGEELAALRPDMWERDRPRWLRPLLRRSALAHLIYEKINQDRRMRGYRRYYEFLYRDDYSGLQRFRESVPRIRDLCREHSASLTAVLLPLLNQDLRPGRYPFLRQHGIVRGAFETNGVPFLDLYDSAFQYGDPVRLQNVPQIDPHPNEIAHRIAAEEIFRFLLKHGDLDPVYTPRLVEDEHLMSTWYKKMRATDVPIPPAHTNRAAARISSGR